MEHIDELVRWIRTFPSFHSVVEISILHEHASDESEEGAIWRGLTPKSDIHIGDIVVEVPEILMLDYTNPETYMLKHHRNLLQEIAHLDADLKLVIVLMVEVWYKEQSFWKHYIDTLPVKHNSSALWTDEEIGFLFGSPAYKDTLELRNTIKEQFESKFYPFIQMYKDTFPVEDWTKERLFEFFSWSVLTLVSRSFLLNRPEEIPCLVPFADMMNHTSDPHGVFVFDQQQRKFRVGAFKECNIGTEFRVCYGDKPNSELLLDYGFIVESNPYDVIPFPLKEALEMPLVDIYSVDRYKVLDDNKITNRVFNLEKDLVPIECIVALRVHFFTDSEFSWFKDNFSHLPLSIDNELKVMNTIKNYCKKILSKYKIKDDEAKQILQTTTSHRIRTAVQLCQWEKQLIESVIDYAESEIVLLTIQQERFGQLRSPPKPSS